MFKRTRVAGGLILVALAAGTWATPALSGQDEMQKHLEEGIRGVTPETTHAKDHETAAAQEKAEKERAMQHHMREGTAGVAPETTHAKDHETAAAQEKAEKEREMQRHMDEGTAGTTPHEMRR